MAEKNKSDIFNLISVDALKKRRIKVLSYYDILTNEDDDMLFAIDRIESSSEGGYNPRLYYDGGQHAIFIKDSEHVVICDFVHPGVRELLSKTKKVLFAELAASMPDGIKAFPNEFGRHVHLEYEVDVQRHPDIEKIAEELMELSKKEDSVTKFAAEEFRIIKKIVAQRFVKNEKKLRRSTKITKDLKLSPNDLIGLIAAIEEEFEIIILGTAIEKWKTLGDIADYVAGYDIDFSI